MAPDRSPGAPTLLLFPTATERRAFESTPVGSGLRLDIGVGPLAAGVRTARFLERFRPRRVVLVGIAGTYAPDRLPIGAATTFDSVSIDGIGAGEETDGIGLRELGFDHGTSADGSPLGERIELVAGREVAGDLLTVCRASGSARQAEGRAARFPTAVSEDMEGFAVAVACAESGVPLTIVRGISNVAGDRDRANWKIAAALEAAALLTGTVLGETLP